MTSLKNTLASLPRSLLAVVVLLGVASGILAFWLGRATSPVSVPTELTEGSKSSTYYCSMHPHIRLPEPGVCPICQMDLTLLDDSDPGPRTVELGEEALKIAEIETAKVERRPIHNTVRMVGKVDFDETRVRTITAWVPGRLDRLYVDYTGVPVQEGEHLMDLYSPELYAAQQELLEALKAVRRLESSGSELLRESTRGTVDAVREKLRFWGLSAPQIRAIEKQDSPRDHILVNAPTSGVVIEKLANQGEYVQTGTPVYRIADLSRVWVKLEAYESDLVWLRYGQDLEFVADSHPGETFRGRIDFIDWVIRPSRTAQVRVNVENPGRRLKPGTFVRAEVQSRMDALGSVLAPSLLGKWICPMHPEVVAEGEGSCTLCGMALVPGEEVFPPDPVGNEVPLVIPDTAPLVTGRRAVVYVRLDREKPSFRGRDVILGPRAQGHYVVLSGLEEGEEVVVRGAFKIDSALQIRAEPSMMHPRGGGASTGHRHPGDAPEEAMSKDAMSHDMTPLRTTERLPSTPELQDVVSRLWTAYFEITSTLASDDFVAAQEACSRLAKELASTPVAGLTAEAVERWKELEAAGKNEVALGASLTTLAELREELPALSRWMTDLELAFGHSDGRTIHELFCPMAFDGRGALWLQGAAEVENPFYGKSMLRCGEMRRIFPSGPRLRHVGVSSAFRKALGELFVAYLSIQVALAADASPPDTASAARGMATALEALKATDLPDEAAEDWRTRRAALATRLRELAAAQTTPRQRQDFEALTGELTAALEKFGHRSSLPVIEMFCPMAFDDKGALWLQGDDDLRNPYFGASMLRCGTVKRTLPPSLDEPGGGR